MQPYSTFNADQSENISYNLSDFPVYLREGLLTGSPDDFAISHWHEDLEFIVILSGKMTYNVNGNLVSLSKECGIFVNSRQLHYGFSSDYRNIPAQAASNRSEEENLLALKRMLLRIQTGYAEQLTLAQIAAAGPCCRSKCATIFRTYLRESPIQYLLKYRLQKAAELLNSSSWTITEISYVVGFSSASYFCEVFHRRYGVSPREFRKRQQP